MPRVKGQKANNYNDLVLPLLPDVEWAYFAGLIDGEGTINIDAVAKENQYICFRPALVLVSTTPALIDWAWNRFPFGSRNTNKERRSNWKRQHRILWTYRAAVHILRGVLPFLVLKSAQAEVAINMPLSPRGRWTYSNELRIQQYSSWRQMRALRGPTSGRSPSSLTSQRMKRWLDIHGITTAGLLEVTSSSKEEQGIK